MKYRLSYELSRADGAGCKNIHCAMTFADIIETISYYLAKGFSIHNLTITNV